MIDSKMAGLLSDFFLDIAKAFFVATFITPPFTQGGIISTLLLLMRGMVFVTMCLWASRSFLEIANHYESSKHS